MPTPPKTLTAEQILASITGEPTTAIVDIPAFGGKVKVRQYLAGDQMKIAERIGDGEDPTGLEELIWTAIFCCVEPAFSEEQFEQLKNLPVAALVQLSNAIGSVGGSVASIKATKKSDVSE